MGPQLLLRDLLDDPWLYQGLDRLPRPPYASFGHGAAGVAYFLLRSAAITGEAACLRSAGKWATAAEAALAGPDPFTGSSPVFPDARAAIPASVYFGEAGVWCCGAVVAAAQGDAETVERRLELFTSVADACPLDRPDVVSGAAGLLSATAVMVEQLAPSSPGPLLATGERLAHRLGRLAAAGLRQPAGALGWLGAAHGWCGISHALLRWCQATETPPAADLVALLDRLRGLRLPGGLWPRSTGTDEIWPGWCHGSAGWAQLWTLAWEVLGDHAALALAETAGHAAVAIDGAGASLCCGAAGAAYASLALFRATGESVWLNHAARLADQASAAVTDASFPEHSLWQGDLGVALLRLELDDPSSAAMPLYRRR